MLLFSGRVGICVGYQNPLVSIQTSLRQEPVSEEVRPKHEGQTCQNDNLKNHHKQQGTILLDQT